MSARLLARTAVVTACLLAVSGGLGVGCSVDEGRTAPGAAVEDHPSRGSEQEALRALLPSEIVGALAIGASSASVAYSNPPLYRALAFDGVAGRRYRATVARDGGGGHAAVWIARLDGTTLGQGTDQAEATVAETGKYYVVFRDASFADGTFTVTIEELAMPIPEAGPDVIDAGGDATVLGDASEAGDASDAPASTAFVIPPALENVPLVVDLTCSVVAGGYGGSPPYPPPAPPIAFAETITLRMRSAPAAVTYFVPAVPLPSLMTVKTSKVRVESTTGPDVPLALAAYQGVPGPDYPDTQSDCPRMPIVGEFLQDSTSCLFAIGAACAQARPACRYIKYNALPHVTFTASESPTSYSYGVLYGDDYQNPNWTLSVQLAGESMHVSYVGHESHGTTPVGTTDVNCQGDR